MAKSRTKLDMAKGNAKLSCLSCWVKFLAVILALTQSGTSRNKKSLIRLKAGLVKGQTHFLAARPKSRVYSSSEAR